MPANLTPQYLDAEKRFKAAKTREERILGLEEMYALCPKHKGTDKLRADIRHRLAKLRQADEQKSGKQKDLFFVRRDGAVQVVILGAPNTGKSLLLSRLTGARAESAPYPFTTATPLPGMMPFEDIKLQLVDTPAITRDQPRMAMSNLIRNADLILLVTDLADMDSAAQVADVDAVLKRMHVVATAQPPREYESPADVWVKTLILCNKCDEDEDGTAMELFREEIGGGHRCIAISAEYGTGLEELKQTVFTELEIIRVYTKQPGKPPDMQTPFVMKKGSDIIDLARTIHKDFSDNLKYARVWGSGKIDGMKAQRDYELKDRDIVELRI